MTNKDIARVFSNLAAIMELHNENPFKIRSYQNAYITLRKLDKPLSEMTRAEMDAIKGVGKAIGDKITELLETGTLATYEKYAAQTPIGVVEMLNIKGFGPKKIQAVWKELEIETVGELLYACNENRLVELHGFGLKTQAEIRKAAEYYLKSRGKKLWATADAEATLIEDAWANWPVVSRCARVGHLRRLDPVVPELAFLVALSPDNQAIFEQKAFEKAGLTAKGWQDNHWVAETEMGARVAIFKCQIEEFGSKSFQYSATRPFLDAFLRHTEGGDFKNLATEEAVFEKANLPYIPAPWREEATVIEQALAGKLPESVVSLADIKGVVHAHTTYSDGLNTLEEMVAAAQQQGYTYLTISDHSKAAFYANGLKEDRILAQWAEIEAINARLSGFKVLKSIESDILNDGQLDYEADLLRGFDCVIASVHTNLKMPEDKANARLIKAIENPYTHILGHPTGRLLLSREGYPIDHKKIIDACAANKVAIELNANPYRLDLDWTWIAYAVEKGVWISINPDAHSTEGIKDIKYGVLAAQKGRLPVSACLNALPVADFLATLQK